jgi:hypothetical protein
MMAEARHLSAISVLSVLSVSFQRPMPKMNRSTMIPNGTPSNHARISPMMVSVISGWPAGRPWGHLPLYSVSYGA